MMVYILKEVKKQALRKTLDIRLEHNVEIHRTITSANMDIFKREFGLVNEVHN